MKGTAVVLTLVVLFFAVAVQAFAERSALHICEPVPPGDKYLQEGDTPVEPETSLGATTGTLYGYYYDTTSKANVFYTINTATGVTTKTCSIKSTYALQGSSQATDTKDGLLLFTTVDPQGTTNPKGYLVYIDPKVCTQKLIAVDKQSKQANFIKYDNTKNNLYMAFQNPGCIHSSLYQIDPVSGAIVKKLNNVVVGENSRETVGMDVAGQAMYFTYEDFTGFYLTRVDLKTGNLTNAPLNFKAVGGGAQWIYNTYTLDYVPYPGSWGSGILSGVSGFTNASSPCHPVGVFGIVPGTTASMICLQRLPTATSVSLVMDEAQALGYLYQLVDGTTLITFDAKNSRVVSTATCKQCSSFTAFAYLQTS